MERQRKVFWLRSAAVSGRDFKRIGELHMRHCALRVIAVTSEPVGTQIPNFCGALPARNVE